MTSKTVMPPASRPASLSTTPDSDTAAGLEAFRGQLLAHRDEFKGFAKDICQTWVGFILVVTIAQMVMPSAGLGLSDAAFITVLTTTTASVLGFGFVWGSGVFPGSRRHPN